MSSRSSPGGPTLPFLFNIVADVLQQILLHAYRQGLLLHPLVDDLPCPVLQYADDTLIIIRAVTHHVANLKKVLDDFSTATSLCINFHKSTFVPIKMDPLWPPKWLLPLAALSPSSPNLPWPTPLYSQVAHCRLQPYHDQD
jgi:hypothetical protein